MDNNVVNSLFIALSRMSFVLLKFNFRGVGGSEGKFSHGAGEQEDTAAAISFISSVKGIDLEKIAVAGYSAGAAFSLPVASKDDRVKALVAISPPLGMSGFEFLRNCVKPKLLISGSEDSFTPSSLFLEFCQMLPEPKEYHVIKTADHFWWGHEGTITAKVIPFLNSALQSQEKKKPS